MNIKVGKVEGAEYDPERLYLSYVQIIFELKSLSQWDRAYAQKWYKEGVTIEEVKKAEKAARSAKARKPIRYAAAVIENMKKAGRVECSSSFDIKDFWERAVKKSYGGKDDGKG